MAAIDTLDDAESILAGEAGTIVTPDDHWRLLASRRSHELPVVPDPTAKLDQTFTTPIADLQAATADSNHQRRPVHQRPIGTDPSRRGVREMTDTAEHLGREPHVQARDELVLAATGIEKTFRKGGWPVRRPVPVLLGADLELRAGEVVGLVGENGSGKSTLMKILVGALAADAGEVTVAGRLGYCPQEPLVYGRLTCDEHFELFGRAYRMAVSAERRSRRAIYESLGFERYADTRADQLSGGTLSKLNLGLALLADPEVLLLDEPYAGFDWDTYQKFWTVVAERRSSGRSVLIISHFVVDEDRFDRIVEVRDGRTWSR